ncbi:MFS transporter [Pseudomonas asplenii]|uniref:MFS transporter n=1 Tax=Pseudomonas asplenii TaxID=53407 RepID=UPI001E61A3C7|nr:MFS transporter [Pseudomonas asplenii]
MLGILCFFVLRDRPDDATWLTDDEKRLVKEDLAKDEIPEEQHSKGVMRNILCNPVNYLVAYLFFTAACSNYLLFFWLPTMVKDSGVNSLVDVGFLSAIPLLFGFVGAIALSWSSDVLRERRWHLVLCFGLISFGLVAGTIAQTLPWMLFFFAVASFGTGASGPLIWSLPPGYLDRKSAPLGIAFISTLGNVAGFVSPPVLGYIKTVTGSLNLGIIGIAMLGLAGAVLTLFALSPAVVKIKKSIDSPSTV